MENSSSHRCAAGKRCRDAELDHGVRTPPPIDEQRGLCRRCHTSVRRAIIALDDDWNRLSDAVGDHSSTQSGYVSGTRELPMPLNGTVVALRSSLSEWCEASLWLIADSLNINPKIRHKAKGWPVRERPVVEQAAKVLPENLNALLHSPCQPVSVWSKSGHGWQTMDLDGVDVALKLADLHSEVECVLGETNLRKRLSMPCPVLDCGAMTLGINNGEDVVNCYSCGGRWTMREYDWLATMIISDYEETEMFRWLLAEARWKLEEATTRLKHQENQLIQIRRVGKLTQSDVNEFDAYAIVELLQEIVG